MKVKLLTDDEDSDMPPTTHEPNYISHGPVPFSQTRIPCFLRLSSHLYTLESLPTLTQLNENLDLFTMCIIHTTRHVCCKCNNPVDSDMATTKCDAAKKGDHCLKRNTQSTEPVSDSRCKRCTSSKRKKNV
jgi:hypothetical protein